MSISEEEKSVAEDDETQIKVGLYVGGRNSKGQRNGRGWAILPNGDQYDGQYRKGQRQGMGLYVFADGSRYYGQYRCGFRSGRGIFIYPDGSYYEGDWRKNLKHGKGRYCYSNGDTYSGSWYRGQKHGVGVYCYKALSADAISGSVSFTGTWRQGVRLGPFQLNFGTEDNCTTLHGMWDNLYPQGPCVFSFNNQYMLSGYFQAPARTDLLATQFETISQWQNNFVEENMILEKGESKQHEDEPLWNAQDICSFDLSQLPQEPVPLPLSTSDSSECSMLTAGTEASIENPLPTKDEGEAEDEEHDAECFPCECSSSETTSMHRIFPNCSTPCSIEMPAQAKC